MQVSFSQINLFYHPTPPNSTGLRVVASPQSSNPAKIAWLGAESDLRPV
jgi:hypothetical protein